jgi:branched-chain amino acid transport system permease protein
MRQRLNGLGRNIAFPRPGWRRTLTIYGIAIVAFLLFPLVTQSATGSTVLVGVAADAGVFVLMALGLNVVVGFAGLLDLGYAAFFAIGAYTYGMLASDQLASSPLHHSIHLSFWLLLFVGVAIAATCGVIIGAPTLRLRGDYLAIVTLGFGEIVPRLFRNFSIFTGGVNGISAIDLPSTPGWVLGPWDAQGQPVQVVHNFIFPLSAIDPIPFYVTMVVILLVCIALARNLQNSRLGRSWMAVREDEVAAAAMGVNTVRTKLLAFAIGASFSGFAGCYYAAKLILVTPDDFGFVISVTILIMVVLGGMGNIPGVIVGALLIYGLQHYVLPNLPDVASNIANSVGLSSLNHQTANWPGLGGMVQRLQFLIFGLILVLTMLLRPQGLLPSRVREEELTKGTSDEAVFDLGQS